MQLAKKWPEIAVKQPFIIVICFDSDYMQYFTLFLSLNCASFDFQLLANTSGKKYLPRIRVKTKTKQNKPNQIIIVYFVAGCLFSSSEKSPSFAHCTKVENCVHKLRKKGNCNNLYFLYCQCLLMQVHFQAAVSIINL